MLFNQAKLSASAFAYTYKEYANIIFNNLVKKCKYTSFINVRIQCYLSKRNYPSLHSPIHTKNMQRSYNINKIW